MIDKLQMFIALAQARHFGRAAEAMGVTQPTLSSAIKQLEAELGVLLVVRGSRYGGLTPEGKRTLDWARRITGDARMLKDEMRAARSGVAGDLRLAVIPTALAAISPLTARFAAAHPGVRLTIVSAPSTEIAAALENHGADAGVTYLGGEPLGRVVTVPLYEESYALVLREDAPLAGRASLGWAELPDLPLALLTPDMQNRRIIAGHLGSAGLAPRPRIETNSTLALIAHVLTGEWATILPQDAVAPFLGTGRLRAVPLTGPDARHPVGLIAPRRAPQAPVVEALLEAAAEGAR
ncbi:LysR family transcriptional regulator [Wenxinia saemankumensis]|uniref:Transcriptional regulator /transcriptional regulator, LysR family n=1 Tax=Wenxinia saemankumensis TaxID=1447782 RepID=A0A1M6GYC9_9RHOB|nr:LysR family transcriptional regulator [Wenxinia saemankumensis]SHJ14920.1 transcriptional regulator /transcriptional regulator, LysR family [Wenxinia saemankumensis]